jgi:hypothetical protein
MRAFSLSRIILLAGAAALLSSYPGATFAAKMTKLPPGACAVSKTGALNSGAICSFDCNPANNWCSQQMCVNGQLTKIISCYGSFCAAKCG